MTHHRNCDCYDCHRSRGRRRALWCIVLGAALFIAAMFFAAGCSSTVTPAPVEARQASFDQGVQNSGVVALVPGGAIITARTRDRYNGLIGIYGREFLPPLMVDYGVTPQGTDYLITNEALQKFILLNKWHRMGREPKK